MSSDEERVIEIESIDGQKVCKICGSTPASNSYGTIACGGCKNFFMRVSTSGAPVSKCHNSNQCKPPNFQTIGKTKCGPCRYKKCLELGMNPEIPARRKGCDLREKRALVGLRIRGRPRNRDPTKCAPDSREVQLSAISYSNPIVTRTYATTATIRDLVNLQKLIANDYVTDSIVIDFSFSMDFSIADVLKNPLCLCPRVPMGSQCSENPSIPSEFASSVGGRLYARHAVLLADWCRATPEFWDLDEIDQLSIFSRMMTLFSMFNDYYTTYKSRFEEGLHATFGTRIKVSQLQFFEKYKDSYFYHIYYGMTTIIPCMKRIEMEDEEFVLLKNIILFSSDIGLSEKSAQIAKNAFKKYSSTLLEHLKIRFKEETVAIAKFNELMMIPMGMNTLSIKMNAQFCQVVLGKQDGFAGAFPEDIFWRL